MVLRWSSDLYIGESVRKKASVIRFRMNGGRKDPRCFVLTLASNGTDCVDIIPSAFLMQTFLRESLPMIVGLAGSRKEAVDLIVQMTEDCLTLNGNADLRTFLVGKNKRG